MSNPVIVGMIRTRIATVRNLTDTRQFRLARQYRYQIGRLLPYRHLHNAQIAERLAL